MRAFLGLIIFGLSLAGLGLAMHEATQSRDHEVRFEDRDRRAAEGRAAMLGAVGSISDVSMKVKLISLNASIEAAQAGVHGKSFGVIANEIRSLSEDAARSAQGLREQMQLQD